MILSARQILDVAMAAGFQGSDAVTATAIALWESGGGETMAHNPKPPDDSYGLWQINMIGSLGPARRAQFGLSTNQDLYDPATNARVAYAIYRARGGKFAPDWTSYTSGAYQRKLPSANTAWVQYQAEQANPAVIPPDPRAGPSITPATAGPTAPAASSQPTTSAPPATIPAASASQLSLLGHLWQALCSWWAQFS